MKVLYIANYRDGTGWSNAALNNILALHEVGVNVVPRPIKLNESHDPIPDTVVELEQQSIKDCDIVIQHVLPYHLDYCGKFKKNVAYYVSETSSFKKAGWQHKLNLMDEAWVPCEQNVEAAINSHVKIPLHIVPHPTDTSKYEKKYDKFPINEIRGKFTFYFIGENVKRKNLIALLKAFHLEFHRYEPVSLVIKTSFPGMSPEECGKHTAELCDVVKQQLKLHKQRTGYIPEVIITQRLSDEHIMQLHHTCDCFVCPSYGEAWSIPSFDAMAMGKTPICTDVGGMKDFITVGDGKFGGWLVDGHNEHVFGATETFDDLYVGTEYWKQISIDGLRYAMRYAYENKPERQERSNIGIERAYDYSYRRVGKLMKDLLEDKDNE